MIFSKIVLSAFLVPHVLYLDHAVQAQIRSMQVLILAQVLACRAGWLTQEFMIHIFSFLSPAMCSCHVLNAAGQYSSDAVP